MPVFALTHRGSMIPSIHSFIPFVVGAKDASLVGEFYDQCGPIRVSVDTAIRHRDQLGARPLWVDYELDALHHTEVDERHQAILRAIGAEVVLFDRSTIISAQKRHELFESIAVDALDKCKSTCPEWISIPQLPYSRDENRNQVNKVLAKAAHAWRLTSGFSGKLILPVILTHQSQTNKKTDRNPIVAQVKKCLELSSADGVWVSETSLKDSEGSPRHQVRIKGVIEFHSELRGAAEDKFIIAGPYWALNLVLWARNLIDYPAISVSSAFQYYIPGKPISSGNARVAVTPLRRVAVASPALAAWVKDVIAVKNEKQDARRVRAMHVLLQELPRFYRGGDSWRRQTAKFYSDWIRWLSKTAPSGRALALYQDFSAAYVFGADLPLLPEEEAPGRKPSSVSKLFMSFCLEA